MTRALRFWGLVLTGSLALAALACSSDEGGDEGSGGSGASGGSGGSGATGGGSSCGLTEPGFRDTCQGSAPAECCDESLPVMTIRQNGAPAAPNWSCITGAGGSGGAGAGGAAGAGAGGAAGAGAGGAAGTGATQYVFEVEDFGGDGLVSDIDFELFEGETIKGNTSFFSGTTKGVDTPGPAELNNGQAYFPVPSTQLISYRVIEKPGIAKEFVGFGEEIFKGKVSGATVSPSLYNQLTSFAVPIPGWQPPEDLAVVTAPIRDCDGEDVGGAIYRFVEADTGADVIPGTCERDLRYLYFDGNYPNPRCNHSDVRQSLALMVNVPPTAADGSEGKTYKIQFFGRLTESDTEPVLFAEKVVDIVAGTVNVHQIRPNVQQ